MIKARITAGFLRTVTKVQEVKMVDWVNMKRRSSPCERRFSVF